MKSYGELTPDDRAWLAEAGIDGIAFAWLRASKRGLVARDMTLSADVELHASADGALLWRASCTVPAPGRTLEIGQDQALRCALAAIPTLAAPRDLALP